MEVFCKISLVCSSHCRNRICDLSAVRFPEAAGGCRFSVKAGAGGDRAEPDLSAAVLLDKGIPDAASHAEKCGEEEIGL